MLHDQSAIDLVPQHERLAIVLEKLDVGRLAQEAADGQGQLAVDGRHAGVVAAAVADELARPGDRRSAVQLPRQRRGHHHVLVEAEVSETVVLLIGGVDAEGGRAIVVERSVEVDHVVLQAEAAGLHAALLEPPVERLLGDQVDGAHRLALPVEQGVGSLEDFHVIDVGEIARRGGGIDEAVLAEVLRVDQVAAEVEGVGPLVVARLDRGGHVAKQVVEADDLLVFQQRRRNDGQRGRHVDKWAGDRRVGEISPVRRRLGYRAEEVHGGKTDGSGRPGGCGRRGAAPAAGTPAGGTTTSASDGVDSRAALVPSLLSRSAARRTAADCMTRTNKGNQASRCTSGSPLMVVRGT